MRRPAPQEVGRIAKAIAVNGQIARSALVESICERVGCSRATAYRAVVDALAAREVQGAETSSAGQEPS
jgi:hypothetical protein